MANTRTLRFLGQGYGATPATITAAINNTVVFTGEVPTLNQAGPVPPFDVFDHETLFEYAGLPMDFAGNLPVTIQVTAGEMVLFGEILANFANIVNKSTNTPDTSGADGFVRTFKLPGGAAATPEAPYDERINVTIDGEPTSAPSPRLNGQNGSWFWQIPVGSTFSFECKIDAGRDY